MCSDGWPPLGSSVKLAPTVPWSGHVTPPAWESIVSPYLRVVLGAVDWTVSVYHVEEVGRVVRFHCTGALGKGCLMAA